jgi:hypothetical protein
MRIIIQPITWQEEEGLRDELHIRSYIFQLKNKTEVTIYPMALDLTGHEKSSFVFLIFSDDQSNHMSISFQPMHLSFF